VVDNLKAGKYTVLARLENSVLDTLLIVVPDSGKVKANFNMFELTVGNEVFSSFENNSMIDHNQWNKANDVSFKWSFGDDTYSTLPEVQHSYSATGKYVVTLVATSSYGCKDSMTKSMVITIPANFEKLPNVFSPNGDGINDVFSPVLYDMQSVECVIYNRNGELVYEWKTLNGSWDGKIRNTNQLAAKGTYYYVLKGITKSGKNIFYKGMIQLER
jgi:gliding motility-associated-like protein